MKKTFIFILFVILIISCSTKSQNTLENLIDNFSFNTTLSNSNRIAIRGYSFNVKCNKNIDIESSMPASELKTKNKQEVNDFKNIFKNAEKTGYCCCPISSYSIHFFNKEEELDLFYVDTLEFKDKVRIYEGSFQYSYIVEKQKWKDYLFELEN